MWVALKPGDGVRGHVNHAAAPLAYRLNGTLVLSLIDLPRPLPLPRPPDAHEAAAFANARSRIRF